LASEDEQLAGDLEIAVRGVAATERPDGVFDIVINTSRGELPALLHPCEGEPGAAIFISGAIGGLSGPAVRIYERLGAELASEGPGVTSLRLDYRVPGEFEECVLDVLAGLSFLRRLGAQGVALVGHSFGAAVAIKAGELSELVRGVVALSPQLYGTRRVHRLAPKPLLLVHGTADPVLDCAASEDIYERAREPKSLVLYEGADHSLTSHSDELFDLLHGWLIETVGATE
jgi:alpha/beta superfamily hydrolase